ncbi:polysaccharide deacetylase family protein [Alkalihalophilus marmarensis]|uniref:polysaccharide deacetylase family protein n=1 Tax=Alkalihalophilus marmarensis TaxID=521377 RepID=UPI002E22851A|nr:polysaccharide deacetylase family protein [Alkalihalophilus marmarensis]MED1603198.1 polysaccharide deacetylase family protein [Alkalihalophilus marmarensis]
MKRIMIVLMISLMVGSYAGVVCANELDGVHQKWWGKKDDERQVDDEIPEPQGGPEYTERVRQPVSNIILQQRYPDTVILRGPDTSNRIALTFDDGPDPRYTPELLDVLSEYGVPATFFVMGARAERYPEILERINNEGHIIGNHTYWHPNLVEEGDIATLEREVNQTEEVINDIVGYRTRLFRAPYGFLYNQLVEKLAEMDYSVIGWSLDTLDWREMPAEEIAYTVISNVNPGAIILMHDGGEYDSDRTNTIEAVRQLIPILQEQGFEFVTVPELTGIPYQR